nr:protein kinase [Verrucomicrobiales bacterium]
MSSGVGTGSQGKNGSGGYVPPSPADLDVVLDQYEFIEMLGRGGMGAVYKARQKSLDRMVAIKILPPHFTTDEDDTDFHFAERFQREARAMAKLSHPNIIAVYDFGEAKDGQFYIAMEYIEGTDLQVLVRGGQLTPEHVLGWVSQICDALQYAHSRGIVHRDIKPANIMITLEGQVKVADFGLAKLSGAEEIETKLTMTNMAMGTPDYVAPEALEMGVEVDHRADLYAVGVMLYEMLTGKVPRGAWKSPSLQIPGLDPRYDALIDRAMEADRDERFQHASEISTTLYEIATTPAKPVGGRRTLLVGDAAGTGPVKPSVSTSASGSETPASKGRSSSHTPTHSAPKAKAPVKLIAGLAIGAVGVGLGLFFVFKSKSDAPPKTVVFKPETVVPAESTPQATTPPAAATVPVVAQADPGPMPIPPQEKPVASVPVSVSVSAPPPETQSPFSDWTLRHSAPSGTDWRPTGNEISSSKKTTLWSPGEHGDFELELEWKVGPRGNGGVFYHVAAWNELEAFEFQLADPANAGATPTGGLYGIDLPVTNRSKPVGEWNTAKLLVRGSQREHWINGEKVLSYDVDSPDFRDRLGRTTLKTPLNTAARSGRLVLQANAGEIAYRNLRLTPLNTPPAATTSVAPTPPAVTASAEPTTPADPGLAQLQAAPTDPVSRKLAELEKIFLAAYETQVAPKHTTAIATLNTNYLA